MIIRQTNGGNPFTRVVTDLKRASMALLLLAFFLLLFTLAPTYANKSIFDVKSDSSSLNVQVDQVTHRVQIQDGGLVIVNDTLKLSSESEGLLRNFSLGFPFNYGFNLDYCFAYDASNLFEVERNVGLGGRVGFYGVDVAFPEPGLDISSGGYDLTVVFVFSNLISSEMSTLFNATFPVYPSLTQTASTCNVTVILPRDANYTDSVFQKEGLNFTLSTLGTRQILKYKETSLGNFQYKPGWLTFNITGYVFPLINVNEIKREIKLDQWGDLQLSDSYSITNKAFDISSVTISLPLDASFDPETGARDEFGVFFTKPLVEEGNMTTPTNVTIQFREGLTKNEEVKFTVTYSLPWKKYVSQHNWRDYNFTFSFFENFDWAIRELTVTITLPEGAEFQSSNPANSHSIEKSVFKETVTFTFFNVTPFQDDFSFDVEYRYSVFWASFHPTLWMGVLVIIGCAIVFLWRVPKPPAVPMVPVPPEDLRSFVEAYERKRTVLSKLESIEEMLRKRRIPRRRYKVRKKMLEARLSTVSRDLSDLQEKIRKAGPKYANIMRQVEVAETMLEGVETDIRRVEARYRRGEISKGAYGRLLEEYHRRREKAKTTIDGVLLRLREEIR